MSNRYSNPSVTARTLFEALWSEPMRRLIVSDVPGGIAVISAAFDVIVDVGVAGIPTQPKVSDHMRATTRDLMLVNLELDNSDGMVALCRFTRPGTPASPIVAVSELAFHLDARNRLSLLPARGLGGPMLCVQAPRIFVAETTSWAPAYAWDGIGRATSVVQAVGAARVSRRTMH